MFGTVPWHEKKLSDGSVGLYFILFVPVKQHVRGALGVSKQASPCFKIRHMSATQYIIHTVDAV